MADITRQYADWLPEEAATEADAAAAEGAGGQFHKLKTGDNVFRILPPRAGERSPFVRIYQHYLPDPEKPDRDIGFECPERGKVGPDKQKCPVCARANELDASLNQLDKENAKKLWPSMKAFCWAVDRSNEDAGVKVLSLAKGVYTTLLDLAKNPLKGGNFTHPERGIDVIIEKSGEGLKTEYAVTLARRESPLCDDEEISELWLESLGDLRSKVKVLTLDEIVALVPIQRARPATRALATDRPRGAPIQQARTGAGNGRTASRTVDTTLEEEDDVPR
jgi:hypothetical protein